MSTYRDRAAARQRRQASADRVAEYRHMAQGRTVAGKAKSLAMLDVCRLDVLSRDMRVASQPTAVDA